MNRNTSAKIKDTVFANAKLLGWFMGGVILLGIITFILAAIRVVVGNTEIDMVGPVIGFYLSVHLFPIVVKTLVVLLIVYPIGTYYLVSIYKNPILQEAVIKKVLPDISVRDFYQNLEYKLRNIHLTDKLEEVSVFARCGLNDVVREYHDVVECDMTRLKFIRLKTDKDGYRVDVETELRLTECKGKRIVTNYEKLKLTLFGRPEVIGKSVTTLRQYRCPDCDSGINVLEGCKCSCCGNVFDYSEFDWVIESYKSTRKPISLYQFIKGTMITIFIVVFGLNVLFPIGIGKETIFEMYDIFSEQAAFLEKLYNDVEQPNELYEGVTLLSGSDIIIVEEILTDPEDILETAYLERNPILSVDNPQEENLADMLQDVAAGTMVQICAGDVIGSGVLWEMTEDKLVIATAGHVLTMGTGEVQVNFADGWTAAVANFTMTNMDLAFLTVDLQEIPREHLKQYYLVNADEESAEKLQNGDGIIMMASGTGVAADAYEGEVVEPWIYIEDFAQHMILVKVEAEAGMSGGGLFDYEGHFLGILCGENEDGEAVVISLPVIREQYETFSKNF